MKYWLRKFNCIFRDRIEACKKKCIGRKGAIPKTAFKKGSIPWNITPGGAISPLVRLIRNMILNKQWKIQVFKRDNYICQECFQIGGKIEAHHVKFFKNIFNEFLQLYSQFSPIEDKETLVRLAETYEPFWNIDNGITLCRSCHNKNKKRVKP